MKKSIITLVIVLAGLSASAQIWTGGSLSFASNKNSSAFSIAPEVGYSLPDTKFTVALAVQYNHNSSTYLPTTNELIISPYVRYSVMTIEKFALFADLTLDLAAADASGWRLGIQPGIAWMATEHWTAAFRFAFLGYDAINNSGTFTANCATSVPSIGLFYNF